MPLSFLCTGISKLSAAAALFFSSPRLYSWLLLWFFPTRRTILVKEFEYANKARKQGLKCMKLATWIFGCEMNPFAYARAGFYNLSF